VNGITLEAAPAVGVDPMIMATYDLTGRQADVVQAVARGLTTSEIARELRISPHTVRDHVKAAFERVGVTSRGELVAKLFFDRYGQAAPSRRTYAPDSA
jgi:DNA-binding CsgD family transcriptional regulator